MIVRGPKSGFHKTIPLRRNLRRESTLAERLFWSKVASQQFLSLKFRRQHGIGNFIVDFYCPEKKLIVEIDGDSHATSAGLENDQQRTTHLQSFGYTIVRYDNRDIISNISGVFEDLTRKVGLLCPPLTLPLTRGRK